MNMELLIKYPGYTAGLVCLLLWLLRVQLRRVSQRNSLRVKGNISGNVVVGNVNGSLAQASGQGTARAEAAGGGVGASRDVTGWCIGGAALVVSLAQLFHDMYGNG